MPDATAGPAADEDVRRRELAAFLRGMRDALDPAEAPAPSLRRRARGWLREEVAQAAGISSTWYMQLEQGRPVRASPRALDGLCRALRLDAPGRSYLYRLARPDLRPDAAPLGAPPPSVGLRALVTGLSPHPAYALDPRWDIVALNAEADVLLGGVDLDEKRSRNLIHRLFTDPAMRELFADRQRLAPVVVGQFRAATAGLAADGEHRALVAAVGGESAEFRALWQTRDLAETPNWEKAFRHPTAGRLRFRYTVLQPQGADSAYRVTIYTASRPRDAAALAGAMRSGPDGPPRASAQAARDQPVHEE